MGTRADQRRIERVVVPRLEPEEHIISSSRAWICRSTRLGAVTAVRRRFVVVTTDRRLMVFSTGFWTRRLKRRVFTKRIESLDAQDRGSKPLRRIAVPRDQEPELIIELPAGDAARIVARSMLHPELEVRRVERAARKRGGGADSSREEGERLS